MKKYISFRMAVLPVFMAAIYLACQKPGVTDIVLPDEDDVTNNTDSTDNKRREFREINYIFPFCDESQKIIVEMIDGQAVFQGDIILPVQSVSDRAAGISGDNSRWSKGIIPYVIASNHPQKNLILSAINEFNQNTIIRLQARNGEQDYVKFISVDGYISSAPVGRYSGENIIKIAKSYVDKSVILHEILHSVGMWHEQSRSDRDEHVKILYQNIPANDTAQYRKISGTKNFCDYDYASIMHYSAFLYGKQVIVPLKPLPPGMTIDDLGAASELSACDIGGIKKLYLKNTMTLTPGQYKRSPNGEYELKYQNDGNLVLRRLSDGKKLWTSRTDGKPAGSSVMQGDGNLVLYKPNGQAVWDSGTGGNDFAFGRLAVQNDGNLVIYNRYDQPVWSTGTNGGKVAKDVLNPGQSLKSGEDIWSNNRQYQLKYQADGNLVIYRNRNHAALWSSQTNGQAAGQCKMQVDGNLVIYTPSGQPVWQSGTNSSANQNSMLVMQDDGNLVIYRPGGQPIWASGTDE